MHMLSGDQKRDLLALISMMDEPDEKIYNKLKEQVLSYNIDALPFLEDAWMTANNLLVTNRLSELMEEVNFVFVYDKFKNWMTSSEQELLQPMLMINRLDNFNIDIISIEEEIKKLVKDIWLELNENLTVLEKINVINHIFFVIHQYNSPKVTDDSLPPFFLSYLLNNKTGNPSSMGILYIIITRLLRIPVFGVNLPGHLIVAYVDDKFMTKNINDYTASDIMFYINPFNKGAVFTRNEIDLYIKQLKIDAKEDYYLPASNKDIIHRYLKELYKSYKLHKKTKKQEYISKLLGLF